MKLGLRFFPCLFISVILGCGGTMSNPSGNTPAVNGSYSFIALSKNAGTNIFTLGGPIQTDTSGHVTANFGVTSVGSTNTCFPAGSAGSFTGTPKPARAAFPYQRCHQWPDDQHEQYCQHGWKQFLHRQRQLHDHGRLPWRGQRIVLHFAIVHRPVYRFIPFNRRLGWGHSDFWAGRAAQCRYQLPLDRNRDFLQHRRMRRFHDRHNDQWSSTRVSGGLYVGDQSRGEHNQFQRRNLRWHRPGVQRWLYHYRRAVRWQPRPSHA